MEVDGEAADGEGLSSLPRNTSRKRSFSPVDSEHQNSSQGIHSLHSTFL